MTVAPSPRFVRGLEANLAFWSECVDRTPDQLQLEHPNLLMAIQYGLALPETHVTAVDLTLKSLTIIENLGQWHSWIPILEKMVAGQVKQRPSLFIQVLNWLGRLLRLNQQLNRAIIAHQEAETIARQHDNQRALAEAFFHLSDDYLHAHKYGLAKQYAKLALDKFSLLEEGEGYQAAILNTLGLIALEMGKLAEAEKNLQRAAIKWRQLGRPTQLARTLKNLGVTLERKQSLDAALLCYQEALECLDGTASKLDKIEVQNNLGVLYYQWEQFDKAEAVFREAGQAVRQMTGNYRISGSLAQNLGSALLKQERFGEAETHLRRSTILWQQLNNNLERANALGSLGEAVAAQGQEDVARRLYDEALALLENYPDNAWAQEIREEIGSNLDALGTSSKNGSGAAKDLAP